MDEFTKQTFRDKGYVEIRPDVFERPRSGSAGNRKLPIVQKPEASDQGQQNRKAANVDRKKRGKKDEGDASRYRVRIVLRFSDLRRRDPDGCAASVLDALIAARRQLAGNTGTDNHQ